MREPKANMAVSMSHVMMMRNRGVDVELYIVHGGSNLGWTLKKRGWGKRRSLYHCSVRVPKGCTDAS